MDNNTLESLKTTLARSVGWTRSNMFEGKCVRCAEPFSNRNTRSAEGWRETKISGLCEDCYDDWTGCLVYSVAPADPVCEECGMAHVADAGDLCGTCQQATGLEDLRTS